MGYVGHNELDNFVAIPPCPYIQGLPSKARAFKRFLNCDECSALEQNVRYFLGFIRNFEGGYQVYKNSIHQSTLPGNAPASAANDDLLLGGTN
jgi:hypothetical protein